MISTARLIDAIDKSLGDGNAPRRIGVAVSGGSDSLALLCLLHAWGRAERLEAATVDHGLRPEAADEAQHVAHLCHTLAIPHRTLRWSGWDGVGNLQAEARAARYALLADWAKEQNLDAVCLGHTMDDQAETFLMRLARSSGVDGLARMESRFQRAGMTFLRPLLHLRRSALRSYLRARSVTWIEDPSNLDDRFDRIKARQALDLLEPLGIDAEAIAQTAFNLWITRQTLDHYVEETAFNHVEEENGDLLLPTDCPEPGRIIPREILNRLRKAAILWVGGAEYPPRADAMTQLDIAMVEMRTFTLGGCLFTSEAGAEPHLHRCRVTREFDAVKGRKSSTDTLWDGRWRLDGSHAPDLEVRALGEAVKDTPWRETGMPRASLMATPSIWRRDDLIAAPVAGYGNGWTAQAKGRGTFADFLVSR